MQKLITVVSVSLALGACQGAPSAEVSSTAAPSTAAAAPAASVAPASNLPPLDPKNIVSIASGSKDHTTLVTALKAADYVPSVANAGPLTVFAPTNAAFEKLPAGMVDGLLKPEKKDELREVLKYHVTTSVYEAKDIKDGDTLSMANGQKATLHVKDGKISINEANVVASIRASNGIVHVIDGVITPPKQ